MGFYSICNLISVFCCQGKDALIIHLELLNCFQCKKNLSINRCIIKISSLILSRVMYFQIPLGLVSTSQELQSPVIGLPGVGLRSKDLLN